MRRYVHTTIKMSLAALITIIIAQALNLQNAVTSGILAVLFMQLTRKDSYTLAIKRIIDGLLAIGLSAVVFYLLGYNIWIFIVFTVFFIALSFALHLAVGIVPSLVLASHILLEYEFSWEMIFNATAILIVSAVVALILNLVYPLNTYKHLNRYIQSIDNLIIQDLKTLSEALSNIENVTSQHNNHQAINNNLTTILNEAEMADKDILFDKDHQHIAYLRMRHAQMNRIDRMFDLITKIQHTHPYSKEIALYIDELKHDIGKKNRATPQLEKLNQLLENFRTKPLPENRQAFETRAILYQMIFELESLLKEKINFHNDHPQFQS